MIVGRGGFRGEVRGGERGYRLPNPGGKGGEFKEKRYSGGRLYEKSVNARGKSLTWGVGEGGKDEEEKRTLDIGEFIRYESPG